MNGMGHTKYVLLGAAGLLGVLLVVGVPLQSAVLLAAVLACPLMMVFMMSGGHGSHGARHDQTRDTGRTEAADRETYPDTPHRHH